MRQRRPSLFAPWALAALLAGTAPATAQDARAGAEAWARGDYPAAIASWRPLAVGGDADAQYNLAQAYKTGRGVAASLDEAERWLERAARQGHPEAEADLGVLLFARNKSAAAIPYLTRAAARGERRAQYLLGTAHFNGDLVPRDWPRAYALTKRASDQGLDVAATRLAQLDELIPLGERQAGLALALTLEGSERQARLAGGTPLPQLPAVSPAPASAPAKTPPPPPPVARPKPAVAAARSVTPAAGPWRVQLGAFSSAGAADAAWASLRPRIAALAGVSHHIVRAGAVHRLQAGGFASRAKADALCRAVQRGGAACFAVRR